MCVAVPGRIISIGEKSGPSIPARVAFGEIERDIDLAMVPEASVGDHVITHSGYAIRVVPAHGGTPVRKRTRTGVSFSGGGFA